MFFCAALVLLFIIKIRFPKGKNIHHIIETRYGRPLLNLFRKFENLNFKIRKTLCDIEFLEVCLENNLTPKFVNFKLYRKDIRHSKQSTKFQTSLMNNELSEKKRKLKSLQNFHSSCFNQLKTLVSVFDFNHLFNLGQSS